NPFQCPGRSTPVPQLSEDLQCFTVCRTCSRMISSFTVDAAQIGERPRGAPLVPCFSKSEKRTLIQFAGSNRVTLRARYVSLLIDGPGGAVAIPKFNKDVRGLAERPLSAWIVAANFDYIRKVVKATRNCQPV